MQGTAPSLRTFLDDLNRILQELSAEGLRHALLQYASRLPGSERSAFLVAFGATSQESEYQQPVHQPVTRADDPDDLTWPIVGHEPLLEDIESLVASIEAGEYFDGYGWDHESHEERSFGDESWAEEFDALLARSGEAFLAGRIGLARAAYGRLLRAFTLDEEVGTFSGPLPAIDMVDTDIPEVRARYLRTVYETTPAADRAATLAEAWRGLIDTGADVGLAAVRESRLPDLPAFEEFLAEWITELGAADLMPVWVRLLLIEATEMHRGVEGLGELARRDGREHPDLFLEWVRALAGPGNIGAAMDAARESLSALEDVKGSGRIRALIAEDLAVLVGNDAPPMTAARRAAWRAEPNLARLLLLHQAAACEAGSGEESRVTMITELDALEQREHLDEPARVTGGLRAALLLLAGRIEEAAAMLDEPEKYPAYRPESELIVPYLLASGSAGPLLPGWDSMHLSHLLAGVDHAGLRGGGLGFPLRRHEPEGEAPSLAGLLLGQLRAEEAGDDAVRSDRLDAAVHDVGRQVDQIVAGKARAQYARAAELLVCCAEALTLARGEGAGVVLLEHWKTRYPRHVAFQRELDRAFRSGSLI